MSPARRAFRECRMQFPRHCVSLCIHIVGIATFADTVESSFNRIACETAPSALAACAPPHTRGPDTSRVAPLSLAWVRHFARGSDGMRVGSMVCAWATPTRISRGWRACHGVNAHCQRFASGTPGQAPLRPQRRPPCPRHPIVGVCYRGGLRLGRHAAPRRGLTDSKRGGSCAVRGPVRDLPADDIAIKRGGIAPLEARHAGDTPKGGS